MCDCVFVPHHICVSLDGVDREIFLICQQAVICAAVQLDEGAAAVVTSVTAVWQAERERDRAHCKQHAIMFV